MRQANVRRKAINYNNRKIAKSNREKRERDKKNAQTKVKQTGHYPTYRPTGLVFSKNR